MKIFEGISEELLHSSTRNKEGGLEVSQKSQLDFM